MTASNHSSAGAAPPSEPDIYLLSRACGELAQSVAALLQGGMLSERALLARHGFLLPAESVLLRAAEVFAWLAQQPGQRDALSMASPVARLELLSDLITNWDGLHEAIDLTWSNHWSLLCTRWADQLGQARESRTAFMGPGREAILTRMQADQARHFNDESWQR